MPKTSALLLLRVCRGAAPALSMASSASLVWTPCETTAAAAVADAPHFDDLPVCATAKAARTCDLDAMKHALATGGSAWWPTTTLEAANRGFLAGLRWAHEHGCPWDPETTQAAAWAGSVPCLAYAHEHGCPWSPRTTIDAVRGGSLPCLQYAHENGCPWHPETLTTDLPDSQNNAGYAACVSYATANGCPAATNTYFHSWIGCDFVDSVWRPSGTWLHDTGFLRPEVLVSGQSCTVCTPSQRAMAATTAAVADASDYVAVDVYTLGPPKEEAAVAATVVAVAG